MKERAEMEIQTDPVELYDPDQPPTPKLASLEEENDVPIDWEDSQLYQFVMARHNMKRAQTAF